MRIYRKLLGMLLVGLACFGLSGRFAITQAHEGGSNRDIVRVHQSQTGSGFAQHPLSSGFCDRHSPGAAISRGPRNRHRPNGL